MADAVTKADEHGPGYAWLTVPFAAGSDVRIELTRKDRSSKTILAPGGWQDQPAGLPVAEVKPARDGQSARLLLGPAICNAVPTDLDVEITVSHPSAPGGRWISDVFFWPSIRRTREAGGGPVIARQVARDVPRNVAPATPAAGADKPQESGAPIDAGAGNGVGADMSATAGRVPGIDAAPAGPSPRPGWIWLGVLPVVLLLAAGTGYAFHAGLLCDRLGVYCSQPPEVPVAPADAPATPPETAAAPPAPSPATDLADGGPERWADAITNPQTPLDQLMELGRVLRGPGRDEASANQGFEAIYAAAFRGHPPALLWMGEANDTSLAADPAGLGPQRNPLMAVDYYRKAEQAGVAEAAAKRAQLCEWLKERRFSGDPRAQQAWAHGCEG
ncbi:hypothetical protein [Ancylobacter amanitiformis]|uniref:Sel1 repeat family protein n=1 Tax=Ancylobacter amanitiformis TaxID=217069 RepID=A0ABU0LPX8_9HYPH|nr:hypothetical protein [Ancylobacter amanitiformis]MDQ0510746.1 hypothetical protein [Ancylobacter amanitiformis]